VDRIVLHVYLRMGHTQDWVRVRWRALTASDDSLENALLDVHDWVSSVVAFAATLKRTTFLSSPALDSDVRQNRAAF
jgi:hypothetical protein